jgi:hypothetical protein
VHIRGRGRGDARGGEVHWECGHIVRPQDGEQTADVLDPSRAWFKGGNPYSSNSWLAMTGPKRTSMNSS